MSEERSFPCPNCGRELRVDARAVEGVLVCSGCNKQVAIPSQNALDAQAITAKPGILLPPLTLEPGAVQAGPPPEEQSDESLPDIRLPERHPGESLTIPALVLPLFTAGLIYFGRFDGELSGIVLTLGTVFVTAILLAVDAWRLGPIDAKGQSRGTGGPLFFGMLILWIVFYPMAFFRRRHFGRPNLGYLALIVAAVFTLAPFITDYLEYGRNPFAFLVPARDDLPPAVDSPEVKALVEKALQNQQLGQIQGIGRHREVKIDEEAKARRGRCAVDLGFQRVTVGYDVTWVDQKKRTYKVRILPPAEDSRGFLGIGMQAPRPRPKGLGAREGGVLITHVVEGTGADKAGLLPGDVIVRINNRTFPQNNPMAVMQDFVIDMEPGTQVKLEVLRNEERLQIPLTIGRRPADVP